MRILVVSSHEQEFGGGEGRAAFEFALEMSRRHEVLLVFPGRRQQPLPSGTRLKIISVRSLDYTVPALRGRELSALIRRFSQFAPHVVHSHTPWFLGAVAQAWAHVHAVPFFFTAHELPSRILEWGLVRYLRTFLQSPLLKVLARTYLASFCRHCTGVVALNRAAAQDIRGIGYRGRIHVIPNGRALALYDGAEPADIREEPKVLTFVGDFGPRKNQAYLVSAMAHLPRGYQLHLVGHDVDHRYRRQVEGAVGPALRGRVLFTGRLDHARIPGQLARTHLWVSASRMEVQSLAVLEALASGTPVLGLANETIDELVDSRVGRRLERTATPEEFARAVRELCETDPESYRRMSENARRRVAHHDWANVAAMTERMYGDCRGTRSAPRGTLALPLLLAVAQAFISMVAMRILWLSTLLGQLRPVAARSSAAAGSMPRGPGPFRAGQLPAFALLWRKAIGAVPKR